MTVKDAPLTAVTTPATRANRVRAMVAWIALVRGH